MGFEIGIAMFRGVRAFGEVQACLGNSGGVILDFYVAGSYVEQWRVRLVVRTLASHAGNRGSTPLRAT